MAKILVIEDDKWFREIVVEMLKQEGHNVVTAVDGVEGLEHVRSSNYDLVITDMLMPNKDGMDTIIELSQLASSTPVIAMSGGRRSLSADFNLKSAKLMGVSQVLVKPFSRTDLRQSIQKVLA